MSCPRVSALLVASLAASTVPAVAAPDVPSELTELSPSTLEPHEVRIGLTDVGIGLWGSKLLERIEVSTHHFLWGLWGFGLPTYDGHAKFEFWREDNLSLSMGIGRTQVDLRPLLHIRTDDMSKEMRFTVTPIEGWAAYRISDQTRITAGLVYTAVSAGAHTNVGPIDELGGAVGTSNLEILATAQQRVSRHWTLIGGGRMLAYQKQWAELRVAVGEGDGEPMASNTTYVEGDLLKVGRTYAVSLAAHYAREHFNLRFGIEYGNLHIPYLNLVVPIHGPMPSLDVYWRF